jgi:solute carrier family 35 protein E3
MIAHNVLFSASRHTRLELTSLAILLVGVALFSVSDVEVNFLGTVYVLVAIASTAHNQMLTADLQSEFHVNGAELQLAIMPEQFSLSMVAGALLDNTGANSFILNTFSARDVTLLVLTCLFAVGVNISTFQLIGKTSGVSYQVVGPAKTIVLLVLGYLFFPSPWESRAQMIRAVTGIVVALVGVFAYTQARSSAQSKPESQKPALLANTE